MHWFLIAYFLVGDAPGPAVPQGKFDSGEACQAAGHELVLKDKTVWSFVCGQELNWSQGSLRDDAQGGCAGRYSARAVVDGREWLIGWLGQAVMDCRAEMLALWASTHDLLAMATALDPIHLDAIDKQIAKIRQRAFEARIRHASDGRPMVKRRSVFA